MAGENVRSMNDWDLRTAWESIPLITRNLVAASTVVTLGSQLGLFPVRSVLLIWPEIFGRFQIWRLVLPFFFLGPLNFHLIFLAAIFYRHSKLLEQGEFLSNAADYLWFLLIVGMTSLPLAYFFKVVYLGPTLLYAILQLWSRRNKDQMVSLFGLFHFPALYYPYALLAISAVLSGGAIDWMGVCGIFAGHVYYFLDSVYPFMPGKSRVIYTPQMLIDLFRPTPPASEPSRRVGPGGAVNTSASNAPAPGFGLNLGSGLRQRITGGHSWGGGGQRLGGGD
eukprot:CAMPEP_0185844416 /NCGR_PEP_ID=MMETSP1354-20130828/595_1 /TAXON_ID=708628 /ORGANISM="Erythrolobus madagascarensis, Strain CCMP3276" /LENGTH=279 /DNA_ID=CAMNT_0028544081 /DNA_START=208 /DNA_END=1047 /DNA_ORIENTATION=-